MAAFKRKRLIDKVPKNNRKEINHRTTSNENTEKKREPEEIL